MHPAHPATPLPPKPRAEKRSAEAPDGSPRALRLGCVSYLNSKPLIHDIDTPTRPPEADDKITAPPTVRFDVPANLLRDLETGEVDLALCPVIDYYRAAEPLEIVPVGGIGCEGSTLTVRLFSRVPIQRITTVHADTDSHTSVALLQVLLQELHGLRPRMIDYHAPAPAPAPGSNPGSVPGSDPNQPARSTIAEAPEAMLLIGDKVVTDSPRAVTYPHQLDLGEAWREMTGLPFLFAVWMTRAGTQLGDIPARLVTQRDANLAQLDALVAHYAPRHGWPIDLATRYLGRILHYRVGPRELDAMRRFADMAAALGLIERAQPLRVRR